MRNPRPFPHNGDLLAIDPAYGIGKRPGAAIFRDGILVAATAIRAPRGVSDLDILTRCARVADDIVAWARPILPYGPYYMIAEWPQVYPSGGARTNEVDPNDLLPLAGVVCVVLGRFSGELMPIVCQSPRPREWIGNVPKSTAAGEALTCARGLLITSCLSPAELKLVPNQHDVVDAVGLGLFGLDRLVAVLERARPGAPGVRPRR